MKTKILALILLMDGILISFGPMTIFKICPVGEKIMKCHWTGESFFGLGILISLLSLVSFIMKNPNTKQGLAIAIASNLILTIAIPLKLIGGCTKAEMPCQSITYPFIYLLSGIGIILSILYINATRKESK